MTRISRESQSKIEVVVILITKSHSKIYELASYNKAINNSNHGQCYWDVIEDKLQN